MFFSPDLTSHSMKFFISTKKFDNRTAASSLHFGFIQLMAPGHIIATFGPFFLHMPLNTVVNHINQRRIKYMFQYSRTESPAPKNICYLMD